MQESMPTSFLSAEADFPGSNDRIINYLRLSQTDRETNLKTPLRQGKGDQDLLDIIADTIAHKPHDHGLSIYSPRKCVRPMNHIGG